MSCASRAIFVIVITLALSACAAHHHGGRPHGSMGTAVERAEQEVASLVDRVIQEPTKADEVKVRLKEIVAEAKASRQQNRQFHQALYELNRSYEAPPEDFLKIIDEMNVRRMQTAGNILRLRFEIKERMTEAEWAAFTDGMADMRDYRSKGHSDK